jgi:hypothetical protein
MAPPFAQPQTDRPAASKSALAPRPATQPAPPTQLLTRRPQPPNPQPRLAPSQITYDAWGVYLSVATQCMSNSASTPSKVRVYAFDKDVATGARRMSYVPYWDVASGIGGVSASLWSVMPARPQGYSEANRDCVFFAGQVGPRREFGAKRGLWWGPIWHRLRRRAQAQHGRAPIGL